VDPPHCFGGERKNALSRSKEKVSKGCQKVTKEKGKTRRGRKSSKTEGEDWF